MAGRVQESYSPGNAGEAINTILGLWDLRPITGLMSWACLTCFQFSTSTSNDGFTVLSRLSKNIQPVIIFVTAYDQFAIQAFGSNAIDYLLKPFDNYVKLNLDDRWYLYRSTISHLVEKFQKFNFLRIHRSLMVNTQYVKRVGYLQNNEYCFKMVNDKKYTSSRSYKPAIDAFVLERANH